MSDTNANPPPVVIEDSKKALRRIFWGILIAAGSAAVKAFALAVPELGNVIIGYAPWLSVVATLMPFGADAVQSWILARAAKQHKAAVDLALELPPPSANGIEKYYQQ